MQLSTNQFHWDAKARLFTAEISTLGRGSLSKNIMLVNSETGEKAEFMFTHADDAGEGEIAGWNYKITMGTVQRYSKLAGCRLLIIND